MEDNTPMMKQYTAFKKQYPDKILLFRMGDFFETFGEDAKISSKVLNITLTKRNKKTDVSLAGFPHKAIDQYLPKFIEAGYCVVVVDQLEDPKLAKGIVKRGVVRVVTPGTLDGEEASSIKNSYLSAFYISKKKIYSAFCDVSTGAFFYIVTEDTENNINYILSSYDPTEVLLTEGTTSDYFSSKPVQFVGKELKNTTYANTVVKDFFNLKNTESLDIDTDSEEVIPIAMVLKYIEDTQLMDPKHILKPQRKNLFSTMVLDRATVRNLELVRSAYSSTVENSLFYILNNTNTRMGTRLLYSWILNPLINKKSIEERLNGVRSFKDNKEVLDSVRENLESINDIERIVGKIGLCRATARDLVALRISLDNSLEILDKLKNNLGIEYKEIDMDLIRDISNKIATTIAEDPPMSITEGGIIHDGYDKEIDNLRNISQNGNQWLKDLEEKEKRETGIPTLKIGFNNVFGYYIDVTKAHQDKVPDRYIRKQTLVNSERYITEELKKQEDLILNAQDNLQKMEYNLFVDFRNSLVEYIPQMQLVGEIIAKIDVLSNFAYVADKNNYVQPTIYDMEQENGIINITKGRHPIVESLLEGDFISNDTTLSFNESNMAVLTGPNMAGKSTYIRQVATIVLMAQIGCFVPAESAEISIVDRIFTRVGASDDLSRGRSTFMVEMDEAANIMNNATKNSLIVLDEVGRGTSTFDGVSIAWALAEYIIEDLKARTLFATHYHELLKLAEKYNGRVKNYNILVDEDVEKGNVVFLRKIVEGGTDRSYGIYVAKMAGLPDKVITRANEILESFEQRNMFSDDNSVGNSVFNISKAKEEDTEKSSVDKQEEKSKEKNTEQFSLFSMKESAIEKEIKELDINNMTPMDALQLLNDFKKRVN